MKEARKVSLYLISSFIFIVVGFVIGNGGPSGSAVLDSANSTSNLVALSLIVIGLIGLLMAYKKMKN